MARKFHEEGYHHANELFADEPKTAAADAYWSIGDPCGVVHAFVVALPGWICIRRLDGPVTDTACDAYVAPLIVVFVD